MRFAILSFAFLYLTMCQKTAWAYVDPGTGGYLFQLLFIAFSAVLGLFAAGKKFAFKVLLFPARAVKSFFNKLTNRAG